MGKYIDADKLIAEIKGFRNIAREKIDNEDTYYLGMAQGYDNAIVVIESLQQEQPKVDLDAEIDKFLYGTKFERDCDGVHVPGICMRDWKGKKYIDRDVTPDDMRKFARYFIEIGKNARKEE